MASKARTDRVVSTRSAYHSSFSVGASGVVAQAPVDAILAIAGENGSFSAGASMVAQAPVHAILARPDENDDRGSRGLGPGDSQYELTAITEGGSQDSSVEIPAFPPDALDDPDVEVRAPVESPSTEIAAPGPGSYQVIDSWGRLQFLSALGFAVASLAVLGFLLVRAFLGGPILSSSTTVLILGCVGTIAFLLLSLSATSLIILLVDLARNVRQLSEQADRAPAGTHGQRHGNRPKLSQPVA